MTIIGTTIGAGFASGREIWEFFGSYGSISNWGILLAMILFSVSSMVILYISWRLGAANYYQVLAEVMGNGMAKWFDKLIFLFILSSSMIMFAGSGATFQQWNWSFWSGVVGMFFAVLFILFYDAKGLLSLNVVLMPILAGILIGVSIRFFYSIPGISEGSPAQALPDGLSHQWPAAITYTSLNIVPMLAVLSSIGKEIKGKGDIWVGGFISFVILAVIAFSLNQSLIINGADMMAVYDIPLFSLVQGGHPIFVGLVTIVLWFAIYTTAVSGVYGISTRLAEKWPLPLWVIGGIVMVSIMPLTQFGFANLIHYLYPIYGIINLFVLSMILLYPINQLSHQ